MTLKKLKWCAKPCPFSFVEKKSGDGTAGKEMNQAVKNAVLRSIDYKAPDSYKNTPKWVKALKPRKNQKRTLHVCPKCGKKFYLWQYATQHAHQERHWGSYR